MLDVELRELVPRVLSVLVGRGADFATAEDAAQEALIRALAAWEDEEYCRTALGLNGPLGPIDRARLNVNGGSLATGHPFAATGGRIVGTLAKMLAKAPERSDGKPLRGLISICAAGGQGVVAILER